MSLQIRLGDFVTAVGTDYKNLRTWITGSSTGDLTGLSTTVKTSLVAAINEVNAKVPTVPDATETVKGILKLATQALTNAGTDDLTAVTPLKLQTRLAAYAQPLAANLTNLAGFTTSTSAALVENSDSVLASQKAIKAYVDAAVAGVLDANNAYQYKGVIDCSANPNYPAASAGHTYKVSVAGKIGGAAGPDVEVGDSLVCLVDGSAAGNNATVGANWMILQTNIDGAVTGPAASVAGNIVAFSGTTGKIISDSGVAFSTDGTLAGNSDAKLPTEKAIRTYLSANYYTKTELGNPETDLVAAYTAAKA